MAAEDVRVDVLRRIQNELQIPNDHFRLEDNCVRCLLCTTALVGLKRYTFERHLRSAKHQAALERRNQPVFPSPQHLTSLTSRHSAFFKDFASACMKSDIPFDKVCQPAFAAFSQTHTQHKVPDATTMSKTYVPIIYNETLTLIREEIGDCPIWVSVDETIDSKRRCVTNVIIGALYQDRASTGRLIRCGEVVTANAAHMAEYVAASLDEFWPAGFDPNRVLLLLTDAAPYMKASAGILKRRYPKLVNVTCLAHACHNVAEKVRECYKEINDVVASAKEVFSKSKTRTDIFKAALPNVPLPPRPVTTRWGTWISACQYYSLHYDNVRAVFMDLEDNSQAVRDLQGCLRRHENREEFEAIAEKFSCLVVTIKQLQTRGCSLSQTCDTIAELKQKFRQDMEIPQEIRDKIVQVFRDNEGFTQMINVNSCLIENRLQNLPENWVDDDAFRMKYAPLTCADVERSFSIYKAYYRSNRQSMAFQTLCQHIVINYNKNMGRGIDDIEADSDSDE